MTSRIMIVGGPGSGKTTLAHRLTLLTGLPSYSVDDAVRDGMGVQRTDADIDSIVRGWAQEDRWIIEGGNTRTYQDRALRADLIIRMAPPVLLRLLRVVRRDGFNLQLLRWTLRYDPVFGDKDRAICGGQHVVVRNIRDIEHLIGRLKLAASPIANTLT